MTYDNNSKIVYEIIRLAKTLPNNQIREIIYESFPHYNSKALDAIIKETFLILHIDTR